MPDVQTNRSVRFIFWNNEEFGMDGSGTYAQERAPRILPEQRNDLAVDVVHLRVNVALRATDRY